MINFSRCNLFAFDIISGRIPYCGQCGVDDVIRTNDIDDEIVVYVQMTQKPNADANAQSIYPSQIIRPARNGILIG